MGSLVPDFENDIFISYRQNDNKYDGWVTDFVNDLNRELESTFKQKITVYFDANPHDGLLETYSVGLSLEQKLKSVIFIPVLSRTYCDEKSFAWNNEFLRFLDIAASDQLGLNIRLAGGNFTSRVLPVRIHDLRPEDKSLVHRRIGVIRAVDFIYRSPGVNRPLRACEDHPHDNLNRTYYRDQINKVANAVTAILRSITMSSQSGAGVSGTGTGEKMSAADSIADAGKSNRRRFLHSLPAALFLTFFILSIVAMIFVPGLFRKNKFALQNAADDRLSVAIFPFWNMTADTSWNIWQEAVQSDIAASLSDNSADLYIRQAESINKFLDRFHFSEYNSFIAAAAKVSSRMKADFYIHGTLKKAGNVMRINAQLIKAENRESYRSFQVEGPAGNILHLTDSLSVLIRDVLMLKRFEYRIPAGYRHLLSSTSSDALRFFSHGHNAFFKKDYSTALRYLSQSAAADSSFTLSLILLDLTYCSMGDHVKSKQLSSRIYRNISRMTAQERMLSQWLYSVNNETPYEELKYLRLLLETEPALPFIRLAVGHSYLKVRQYDDAARELDKALKEQAETGLILPQNYIMLGTAWHMTGQFRKEQKIYRRAEKAFPADADLCCRQAVLALTKKDTAMAEKFIKKYSSCLKLVTYPEYRINQGVAGIYAEAGYYDKAESVYRSALLSSGRDPEAVNNLASFLVDNGKTDEALDLIGPGLKIDSLNYNYLYTKGRGLYRKSEYAQALLILNRSWKLRSKYSFYDHEAYMYLDSVKKKAEGTGTVF